MLKTLRTLGVPVAAAWLLTFLFHTPRGEQLLERIARVLFPDWLCRWSDRETPWRP